MAAGTLTALRSVLACVRLGTDACWIGLDVPSVGISRRQVLSIFLSSFLFGHTFSSQGWVGIGTVAMCLFGRIYLKRQEQLKK